MIQLSTILHEVINYDYYQDKIDRETYEKLIALDPTNGKGNKYSPWIIRSYLIHFGSILSNIPALKKDRDEKKKKQDDLLYYLLHTDATIDREDYKEKDRLMQKIESEYLAAEKAFNYENRTIERFFREDSYKITKDLTIYDNLKRKNKLIDERTKNIMNFKTFLDFYRFIKNIDEEMLDSLQDESDKAKDMDILYKDSQGFMLAIPNTYEADRKLGRGTRWCTAADSDRGERCFVDYSNDGPLYVIFTPELQPKNKVQIHIESGQWMDADDNSVNDTWGSKDRFLKTLPEELKEKLYNHSGSFIFDPHKGQTIQMLCSEYLPELQKSLLGFSFYSALKQAYDNDNLSNYFGDKFLQFAVGNMISKSGSDEAYMWGYQNPDQFLKGEEPKDKDGTWSDEQKERAGQEYEQMVQDAQVREQIRDVDRDWEEYPRDTINELYTYVVTDCLSMEHYPEETIDFCLRIIELAYDVSDTVEFNVVLSLAE